MAIHATYHGSHGIVPNAVIKLDRIWGSKSEGWNAWTNVYSESNPDSTVTSFCVSAPYVEDQNPFVALYSALGSMSFLENVKHDHIKDEIAQEIKKKNKKK